MFGHQRKARILFELSDILLAILAFEIAYRIRTPLKWHFLFYLTAQQKALILGFSLLAWVATGLWLEVYKRLGSGHPRIILRDSARQVAFGSLSLLVFEYALRMDLSRFFLGSYCFLTWLLLSIFRLSASPVGAAIRRDFGERQYVMIAGTGERALRIAKTLEESARYGVRVTGILDDSRGASGVRRLDNYRVYQLAELPMILRHDVVDAIVFAVDSGNLADLEEVFLVCDQEGICTHLALDFFPHVNSVISLDRLGATPLLTFSATPHDDIRLLVKRVLDFVIAAAGLIVLSPFMAIVAILVRLTSPGQAIFRQVRCGLNGRRFVLYKFRSMCENAEDLKAAVAHLSARATAFKAPHDPRITPLGRYLRKFSIDEWPQLWNVVRGEMSLVGPRPALPNEVEHYQQWQRRRLRMRPGITCLWALAGRDAVDFETWMNMDMQYIDSWSLLLDLKILLRTIPLAILGRGAS